MTALRAITLTQPWCGIMAAGIKLVENRTRPIIRADHIGKPIALHASREYDDAAARVIERDHLVDLSRVPHARTQSAILAVGTLVAIVRTHAELDAYYRAIGKPDLGVRQREWKFEGSIGYVFADMIALREPVPSRGWQGCWTVPWGPRGVADAVIGQMRRCGATGVDPGGHCLRCGLVVEPADDRDVDCPPGFLTDLPTPSTGVAA